MFERYVVKMTTVSVKRRHDHRECGLVGK